MAPASANKNACDLMSQPYLLSGEEITSHIGEKDYHCEVLCLPYRSLFVEMNRKYLSVWIDVKIFDTVILNIESVI